MPAGYIWVVSIKLTKYYSKIKYGFSYFCMLFIYVKNTDRHLQSQLLKQYGIKPLSGGRSQETTGMWSEHQSQDQ